MNERHEQLMAQAWIEFAPDAKAVTKRFAELIVRECAKIANSQFEAATGLNDRDSWTAAEMKKHFGVK
jgi:hypothetical protein